MRTLLPPLAGQRVLDIGCGSGWYAEHMLNAGAQVTAFDLDEKFVAITQARVEDRAAVLRANLAEPLHFAADGEFDLAVAPLVRVLSLSACWSRSRLMPTAWRDPSRSRG